MERRGKGSPAYPAAHPCEKWVCASGSRRVSADTKAASQISRVYYISKSSRMLMFDQLKTYEAVLEEVDGDVVFGVVSFDFVGVTGSAMVVERTVSVSRDIEAGV
jgi:hypothetical protein